MAAETRPSTSYGSSSWSSPDNRRVKELIRQGVSPASVLLPFSARQRSHTMTSRSQRQPPITRSTSEINVPALKHTASASSDLLNSKASAPDMRSASAAGWRDEKPSHLARSLLQRSSRLLSRRRSNSKLRSSEWQETRDVERPSYVQESGAPVSTKHQRGESEGAVLTMRPPISEPFNFQHYTHAGVQQARALQNVNHNELITEFSALRAGQAPNSQLKGIKTKDLSTSSSLEAFPLPSAGTSFSSVNASRPSSPPLEMALSGPRDDSASPRSGSLRTTQSVESFTRLASKSFSSRSPPLSPPPRHSSRASLSGTPKLPSLGIKTVLQEAPARTESPIAHTYSPAASFVTCPTSPPTACSSATEVEAGWSEIAQAVTTPDDSACVILNNATASPTAELEDIPEEVQTWHGRDSGFAAGDADAATSSVTPLAHVIDGTKGISKACSNLSLATSDPVLPPSESHTEEIPSRASKRYSNMPGAPARSWEDDVDYCYEHAMEADCDPDWAPAAASDGLRPDATSTNTAATTSSSSVSHTPYPQMASLETGAGSSASSSSVTVPGVLTPASLTPSPQVLVAPADLAAGAAPFPFSASLLIPKDFAAAAASVSPATSFDESCPPPPFPSQDPFAPPPAHLNTSVAPRAPSPRSSSSHSSSPLTRHASKETLLSSRPTSVSTSIGSAAAARHRLSGSLGSLPADDRSSRSSELLARPPAVASVPEHAAAVHGRAAAAVPGGPHAVHGKGPAHGKAASVAAGVPPVVPPRRSRASSDSAGRLLAMGAPPAGPGPAARPEPVRRLRSSSSATSLTRPRHRASYSLFPPVAR